MIFAQGTSSRYRLSNVLVGVSLGTMLVALGLLYYWLFDRRPVVEVIRVEPAKPVFVQGEPIIIHKVLRQRRACDADMVRSVIDERGTVWPLSLPAKPLFGPGDNDFTLAFDMPVHATPGRFRFQDIVTWRCNPLSSQRQVLADVPFTVIPAPPTGERAPSAAHE